MKKLGGVNYTFLGGGIVFFLFIFTEDNGKVSVVYTTDGTCIYVPCIVHVMPISIVNLLLTLIY